MSESIYIKNLGPINELQLSLSKKMKLIIGPQATGKSTLAKIIYFCKKIRDYTVEYLVEDDLILKSPVGELYLSYLKYIRLQYMNSFGTTRHFSKGFRVKYDYQNGEYVEIKLDEARYAKFRFSAKMENDIKGFLKSAYQLYQDNHDTGTENAYDTLLRKIQIKREAKRHFTEVVADAFGDGADILYIPAGRSLLSVMSDQIDSVNSTLLDLPMQDFVNHIHNTKIRFGSKFDTIVADYVKTIKGQIKNANVDIAKNLIRSILKADYINDPDGEKLFFDEKHWVKLIYGSSGQQEALWILLLLFIVILEDKKSFIIVEEPEAHLFPEAQKDIVELMVLTVNSSNSQMIITTHSPYILTSANLMIHSAIVENKIRTSAYKAVIPKPLRLSSNDISAHKFREEGNKGLFSIMDQETGMICSSEIDTISEWINEYTEKLLDLELKYDL